MTTSENVQEEYSMSKYNDVASLYVAMCDEIALLRNDLRNLVTKQRVAATVAEDALPETSVRPLPEQQFTKTVYVKVKGVKGYEVHQYTNNIEEDNSTIINNVKKDLKSDKVDVVSVFVAEKL